MLPRPIIRDCTSHSTLYNLNKLVFILWEYTVILAVLANSGSMLKCDHFIPGVG